MWPWRWNCFVLWRSWVFLATAIPSGIKRFYMKCDKCWLFWDIVVANLLIKSLVSFTYDGISFIIGWRWIVDIFRNFGRVAVDRADYRPTWIVFLVYFLVKFLRWFEVIKPSAILVGIDLSFSNLSTVATVYNYGSFFISICDNNIISLG